MNRHLPESGEGRRQFFRDGLRYTLLGALAAISGKLLAQRARLPSRQTCIRDGLCGGCEAFDDCGLPAALSAKLSKRL